MNAVGRQVSRSGSTAAHHHRQYSDNFLDTGRWLQSSSLDFGYGSRMNRSVQSTGSSTPPVCSRSSSMRKTTGELSPGLLDLHSFDTELVPRAFPPESSSSNVLKSGVVTVDKERANNNVAKIKVVVRKRPLNKKETGKKEEDIISIEPNSNYLTVHETKLKVDLTEYVEKHEFVFDAVLDEGVSNDEVSLLRDCGADSSSDLPTNESNLLCLWTNRQVLVSVSVSALLVVSIAWLSVAILLWIKLGWIFIFPSGSGKTYTMQPLPLKASQDILRLMRQTYWNQGLQLFVSFFEIYGGKLFDLLNDRKKLCMREDGKQQVCIVGLKEYRVSDVEAIRELIEKGNATRSTGTTGANEESSRSHAILQLVIKRSANGSDSKPARPVGKLSFIDLAGSERGADTTDNDKQTRIEGAEINKSLLALKECIRALDNDQGHIPFRGSKLTEVLRDSFVGDSRTVMISCISPSSGSCEHTLNTLRYADRVKSLSKGNISKRDPLSSSNLRESTALPFASVSTTETNLEDGIADVPHEKSRSGWTKPSEKEQSPAFNVDRVPSGRAEGNFAASVYSNSCKGQRNGENGAIGLELDYIDEAYEQVKPSWMNNNKKLGANRKLAMGDGGQNDVFRKQPDVSAFLADDYRSDDDLTALLKEEEDLVSAHRKQVEETLDIVREEMTLLVQADQPGNPLDDYISRLNSILSQKAAGILQLQNRLAQFQRRLNEQNVLVSSFVN
ncbi:hypothetical protein Tsubulata_034357 [Turnera subulata]|uniref:Kinesin-like protein n=1 Tax=Turnera subulata TaxID=218843 RepID=A0A9Q0JA88_9ROSI|nr:hypothetical protein Tsubulata_034357 [Turnera subulata]